MKHDVKIFTFHASRFTRLMSHAIKIKVRPHKIIRFPGLCVHCGQPGAKTMTLKKRIGRVSRMVDVPLCGQCWSDFNQRSSEEGRLGKLGWVTAVILFTLSLAVVLLLTPAEISWLLRLVVALVLGLMLAQLAWQLFRRAQLNAELPAKKSIRQSADITHFSWRATTFEFTNETFAKRFEEMNKSLLMDV